MREKIPLNHETRRCRRLQLAAGLMLVVVACALPLVAQNGGDPLVPFQWHLRNVGQDAFTGVSGTPGIDLDVMVPLSEGLSGRGINAMVVDSGVEIRHPDLVERIGSTMLHNFDVTAPDTNDPTPPIGSIDDMHGTGVAGIIAATAGNGVGGQGVAPQATLGAARIICEAIRNINPCPQTTANFLSIYGGRAFSQNVDVFNASYGGSSQHPQPFPLENNPFIMLFQHVETMRGGLGAVIAKSAGNGFQNDAPRVPQSLCVNANKNDVTCVNANSDPQNAVAQVITVAAVNAMGKRASYSSAGSSILISGLGGEFGAPANNLGVPAGPAIVTTDLTGCNQGLSSTQGAPPGPLSNPFDVPGSNVNSSLNPDCDYTARFNGTSAAAPTVSGVIALMLEANPALTWRDVRTILMETARPIDTTRVPTSVELPSGEQYVPEPAWTKNAAGHLFDNWYGFGLVDAKNAIDVARNFAVHLMGPMLVNTASTAAAGQGKIVPQGNTTGLTLQLPVSGSAQTVEYVQVSINMLSADASDLAVEAISPGGTRSVLQNAFNGFANTGEPIINWLLSSNAFNGESALGVWTVRFIDVNSRGGNPMQFESVTLNVLGH